MHICQTLAHYVTYLGSQLGLPLGSASEQFMLGAAPEKWRKQGIFRWSVPCSQVQGFDAAAEVLRQSGLNNLGCDCVQSGADSCTTSSTHIAEIMHTTKCRNAGSRVGSHAQDKLNACALPAETDTAQASFYVNQEPDLSFPSSQVSYASCCV